MSSFKISSALIFMTLTIVLFSAYQDPSDEYIYGTFNKEYLLTKTFKKGNSEVTLIPLPNIEMRSHRRVISRIISKFNHQGTHFIVKSALEGEILAGIHPRNVTRITWPDGESPKAENAINYELLNNETKQIIVLMSIRELKLVEVHLKKNGLTHYLTTVDEVSVRE